MTGTREPLVSICVPAYNAEKTLRDTLDSIVGQSYRNIRVVVSDNASSDSTPEMVAEYAKADPRVTISRLASNIGGEGNFSECIRLGEGEYTAIYHSDDVYDPEMVRRSVEALENAPEAAAVFVMASGIDERGREVRRYRFPDDIRPDPDGLYRFPALLKAVLKYGNFFFCPGVMVRTRVYKETVGTWDVGRYKTSSDLHVWFRIFEKFPVAVIDEPLLHYRLATASYSYNLARSRTWRPDIFLLLDDYVSNPRGVALSGSDLMNYRLQELLDNIRRAFNFLLQGERGQGLRMLSGLFNPAVAAFAMKSAYHLKVMLFGWTVLFLHFIPLPGLVKEKLFKLRYGG
ncbi:MAG: glycosyltransferase family 2 protein [Elusimicrobia bacterium]|nr:glycosyltransferase family 2 protein [Elusimicrobiota bacterium]